MKNQTLKNILWGGVAFTLILNVLARGGMRFWVWTFSEVLVFTLVYLWLLNKTVEGKSLCKQRSLDIPVFLFFIASVFSSFFSIYKFASVQYLLRLVMYMGVFYIIVNEFDFRSILRLAVLFIVMGFVLSGIGLVQYFFDVFNSWWIPKGMLAATYVNHNHFAGFLEIAIPVSIGVFMGLSLDKRYAQSDLFWKTMLFIATFVMIIAFVFTQSRAGWVCLLCALFIVNIVLIKKKILRFSSLAVFLLVVLISVVYINMGDDAIANRVKSFQDLQSKDFFGVRMLIWEGAVNIIKEHPLIGTGPGTFVWIFSGYRPEGLAARAVYAHNDYLQTMIEVGIVPLFFIVWIVVVLFKMAYNGNKDYSNFTMADGISIGCVISILSLALHGFIDFNFHIIANMLSVACLSGIIVCLGKGKT